MRAYLIILFVSLCLYFSTQSQAQRNPQPFFRNYTTDHGLPSPEVYCVLKDKKGYIWFGTDNGVARFDGYEFEVYDSQDGLKDNVVFEIHEGKDGNLWFGTMSGGAFIFDIESEKISPYRHNDTIALYRERFSYSKLYRVDSMNTAYFALEELGILKIWENGKYEIIRGEKPSSTFLLHNSDFIETIAVSINNHSDTTDLTSYEYFLKEKTSLLERRSNDTTYQDTLAKTLNWKLGFGRSGDAQYLNHGELLIQLSNTLYCLIERGTIWTLPMQSKINEIIEDRNGSIWFCLADGAGLRKYQNLTSIKEGRYEQYLSGNSVSNLLREPEGGYWITTLENGIYYWGNEKIKTYNQKYGLSDEYIKSVTFKSDSELFAACNNGDIYLINISTDSIKKVGQNPSTNIDYLLHYEKTSDQIYCGFVKMLNGQNMLPSLVDQQTSKIITSNIFDLKEIQILENGLLGVSKKAVYFFDPSTGMAERLTPNDKRSPLYSTYYDFDGNLWIGKADGLFQCKDKRFIPSDSAKYSFPHRVEDILQFDDSSLILGTKGYGVRILNGGQQDSITTTNGLTSNIIEDLHIDETGVLWAATLLGLNKITTNDSGNYEIRTFTIANGLPSNEIYRINSYQGQVWLCTKKGLVKFIEPDEVAYAARPFIQKIEQGGKIVSLSESSRFSYNQNDFTFYFRSINYRMGGKIKYQYRISTRDSYQITTNRSANFSSLPPGTYLFEVRASNEDNNWSEFSTREIIIDPPFWKNNWFRVPLVLIILVLLFGGFYWWDRQLLRESALQNKMAALERSALQAQMNPHFIFNSLNSIQNFILLNDQQQAVEYLSRFAQLVRQNLNASINGLVSLEEEVNLLDNYLALEQERFDHHFGYEIIVEDSLRGEIVEFPPMLIQPFVENAVIHGMSQEGRKGKVKIIFSGNQDLLKISIQDNGPGFHSSGLKSHKHKSVGMTITRKRLELLGEKPERAVQIQPLADGEGTEVIIQIKTR